MLLMVAAAIGGCLGPGGAGSGVGASGSRPSGSPSPRHAPTPRAAASRSAGSHARASSSSGAGRAAASAAARITFLDVGQGDAELLRVGRWTGLIDGGPPSAAGRLVADLRARHVRRIDELIVSHPHADHIGGLPAVVDAFPVRRAVLDEAYDSAAYRSLRAELRTHHVPVVHWWRGAREPLGSARALVLDPAPRPPDHDPNHDSIVLLVTVAGRRVLFTGDMGGLPEDDLAAAYHGPAVTVLKVGHHGSATATGEALLAAFRPRWAVIEVGPNPYGHPSPATMARLRARHVRVFTTWRAGDVTLTISRSGALRWRRTGG